MISYIIIAFLIGMIVGGIAMLFTIGMCNAAGDADERLGLK